MWIEWLIVVGGGLKFDYWVQVIVIVLNLLVSILMVGDYGGVFGVVWLGMMVVGVGFEVVILLDIDCIIDFIFELVFVFDVVYI